MTKEEKTRLFKILAESDLLSVYDKLVEKHNKDYDKFFKDACKENAIDGAFNWTATPQGLEFWSEIDSNYKFKIRHQNG